MVAVKHHQAESFIASPDTAVRLVLFYGTDEGLVAERAQRLAARMAQAADPPGEIIRLDDADLEHDPDRLAVELLTVPMFGGAKIVRTQQSRRINASALKPLVDGPPMPGALIVEGGNLRPDDQMRALFEKSRTAAAVACFPDEGAQLDGLVDQIVREARLRIAPDARQELVARLGADRALSRNEIEKLMLYARGVDLITIEHVEAIVGDASELALDRLLAAAAAGDTRVMLAECDRTVAAGEDAQSIIAVALRHFQRLHRARVQVDAGKSPEAVVDGLRPPIGFKQKAALVRQLRSWSSANLDQAMRRIASAQKATRQTGAPDVVLTERLLLEIARLARLGARRT